MNNFTSKKRQNQHLPVLTLPYNGLLVNSFILFINILELRSIGNAIKPVVRSFVR